MHSKSKPKCSTKEDTGMRKKVHSSSSVFKDLAKREIKEKKIRSEESFVVSVEMDKKLSSL